MGHIHSGETLSQEKISSKICRKHQLNLRFSTAIFSNLLTFILWTTQNYSLFLCCTQLQHLCLPLWQSLDSKKVNRLASGRQFSESRCFMKDHPIAAPRGLDLRILNINQLGDEQVTPSSEFQPSDTRQSARRRPLPVWEASTSKAPTGRTPAARRTRFSALKSKFDALQPCTILRFPVIACTPSKVCTPQVCVHYPL